MKSINIIKSILLVVLFLGVWVVPTKAATGINRKINFQGKLVNNGGLAGTNVADGNYTVRFTLWNASGAGTSLWTEVWNTGTTQVAVTSGIFNVALGTYSTFPPTVDFNTDNIFLSVGVSSDADMTPRIQFTAVPYAFNAEKVSGLTIATGKTVTFGDNFTTTGVGISLNQSLATTDMVTFGGLSIGGSASVNGNLSVGGSVTLTNIPIGTGTTVLYISSTGVLVQGTLPPGSGATATNGLSLISSAVGLGGTLTTNTKVGTSSFSLTFLGLGNTVGLALNSSGFVGIGTTTFSASFNVVGSGTKPVVDIFATNGTAMFHIDQNGVSNSNYVSIGSTGQLFADNWLLNVSQADKAFGVATDLSVDANTGRAFAVGVNGESWTRGLFYSNGAFGIGPGNATRDVFLRRHSANSFIVDSNMANGAANLFVTGKIGIGVTNPTYKLQVAGDVSISTNIGIGGSLSLTALPVGVGTSVLYIGSDGNVVAGTMPVTSLVNSKVIVLSPEYPGAVLSADGSGTTAVSMTSDNSLNAGGIGWKNYYELSSTNASLQNYSVLVRVTLPSDFSTWETGSCPGTTCALEFNYQTGLGTTGDNSVSYIVSNDTDTPASAVCSIGNTASTGWSSSGCTESVLNDNSAPEWDAAGETAVIRVKLSAKNTASALSRVGDIILRYRSRF